MFQKKITGGRVIQAKTTSVATEVSYQGRKPLARATIDQRFFAPVYSTNDPSGSFRIVKAKFALYCRRDGRPRRDSSGGPRWTTSGDVC
jgi:hypothetical protein